MSSSAAQDDAPGTTASSSCSAIALHVWIIICLLHVVLVFSSVAVATVFVILLPFACMAASLCLVWAIASQFLSPSLEPPDGAAERGGDSEVAGSYDDGASSREEEEHEGEAELEISCCQACTAAYMPGDHQFSYPCGDEQEQFFWVDTGNYCYKKFYDLLAFWRRKERVGRR